MRGLGRGGRDQDFWGESRGQGFRKDSRRGVRPEEESLRCGVWKAVGGARPGGRGPATLGAESDSGSKGRGSQGCSPGARGRAGAGVRFWDGGKGGLGK